MPKKITQLGKTRCKKHRKAMLKVEELKLLYMGLGVEGEGRWG